MNCITSEEAKELAGWNQPGEVRSIYAVLQHLTDRRGKQGKRYSLALILTLLLLAKAAGETTLQAVAERVRLRSAWLQEVLPGRVGKGAVRGSCDKIEKEVVAQGKRRESKCARKKRFRKQS